MATAKWNETCEFDRWWNQAMQQLLKDIQHDLNEEKRLRKERRKAIKEANRTKPPKR